VQRLSVNVDHIATLRQARRGIEPDPVYAAIMAELAGCDGIIVHLREDRRHIQFRDLELLRNILKTRLNLEMAATPGMIKIALSIIPDLATFVPEKRQELTTEGGLDVITHQRKVAHAIKTLHRKGIPVSLFVNPDVHQVEAAKAAGADFVEIHTGIYSEARTENAIAREWKRITQAIDKAAHLGLRVNAGHGLNYQNIKPLLELKGIEEFSIGHSIIARAVLTGMDQAVRDMISIIKSGEE